MVENASSKGNLVTRPRPTSVLVLAILHFVFGGLGLVSTACVGVQTAAHGIHIVPRTPQQERLEKDIEKAIEEKVPYTWVVTYASLAVDVVLCTLLLAGGFGLLNMQPWGRTVSLVYAVLSILSKICALSYAVVYSLPAVQSVGQELSRKGGEAAAMGMGIQIASYFAVITPLVTLIYPVAVLIILLLPSVATAFRADGVPKAGDEAEDYDDRRQALGRPDDRFQEGDHWGS
jgi:hypothetical protein